MSERACELIDLAADLHQADSSTEADLAGAQRRETQRSADCRDYQSFAALELLGRVGSYTDNQELVDSILLYEMGNRVWQLRDQAARIFASRLSADSAATAIHDLIVSMAGCGQNGMHGRLLCLRYICQNLESENHTDRHSLTTLLKSLQLIAFDQQWAPSVRCLALSLSSEIGPATEAIELACTTGTVANTPPRSGSVHVRDPQRILHSLDSEEPRARDQSNYHVVPQATLSSQALTRMLRTVREATADEMDPQARMDAAEALLELTQYRQLSKFGPVYTSQHIFDMCMALYDLLNDDDEDVRLTAANAASAMLDVDNFDTDLRRCPLAAGEDVLSFLEKHFHDEPVLIKEALSRLMSSGQRNSDYVTILDVSALLKQVQVDANDLFAEERQNLYIDDIREICAWSALLRRQHWLTQGLYTLAAQVEKGLVDLANFLQGKMGFECSYKATSDPNIFGNLSTNYQASRCEHALGCIS